MKSRITKAEARAFKKRWEAVSSAEREELRKTPIARKLRQLSTLMAWGKHFGWTKAFAAEEERGAGEVAAALSETKKIRGYWALTSISQQFQKTCS